jgi:putative endonuclease
VGLTDDLRKRISEHKSGTFDGFTKKYNINRLMYFETINTLKAAELREEQIKKYRREKKIALFVEVERPGAGDFRKRWSCTLRPRCLGLP